MLDHPVECPTLPEIRAYRGAPSCALDLCLELRSFDPGLSRDALHERLQVGLGRLQGQLVGHRAQRQVHFDRRDGLLTQLGYELLHGAARGIEVALEGHALRIEALAEVLGHLADLIVHQHRRRLLGNQRNQGRHGPVAEAQRRLHPLYARHALGDVLAQLGEGGELRRLGSPLIGLGREYLLLHLLHDHLNLRRRVAQVRLEGDGVARLGPREVVVQLGQVVARAQLDRVVRVRHTGHRLAVPGGGHVDYHAVAELGLPLHIGQLGEVAPQPVHLGLHVRIADRGGRDGHAERLVTHQMQLGPYLDDGVEIHRAPLLTRGDLYLRLVDDIDAGLVDSRLVPGADVLVQGVLAGGGTADPGFEHAPGHLAAPGTREQPVPWPTW